jgi:hypothetical protein
VHHDRSSGEINGNKHASKHLITDILKNELDFQELFTDQKILSTTQDIKVAENNR